MEKRTLYIIVVIILIAGLTLSFTNLTGNYTKFRNPNEELGECIDSDDADDPYTPGTVSFANSNLKYRDECYAEGGVGEKKNLKERYCLDKLQNHLYLCSNGCSENSKGEGYCNEGGANSITR